MNVARGLKAVTLLPVAVCTKPEGGSSFTDGRALLGSSESAMVTELKGP